MLSEGKKKKSTASVASSMISFRWHLGRRKPLRREEVSEGRGGVRIKEVEVGGEFFPGEGGILYVDCSGRY